MYICYQVDSDFDITDMSSANVCGIVVYVD